MSEIRYCKMATTSALCRFVYTPSPRRQDLANRIQIVAPTKALVPPILHGQPQLPIRTVPSVATHRKISPTALDDAAGTSAPSRLNTKRAITSVTPPSASVAPRSVIVPFTAPAGRAPGCPGCPGRLFSGSMMWKIAALMMVTTN